eukprot:6209254-Pleurochrysis_carterae.AAC.1
MDLQNARFYKHDGVLVNTDCVETVHGVRDDRSVRLALLDLLVQRLALLGSHTGVVNLLRRRMGTAPPHGLTRRGRNCKLRYVRVIIVCSDNRVYREGHWIALPVEVHLVAQESQDSRRVKRWFADFPSFCECDA